MLHRWDRHDDVTMPHPTEENALRQLAAHARSSWAAVARQPGVSAAPPLADQDAVDLYYGPDGSEGGPCGDEESDGGWPGADVTDILTSWLASCDLDVQAAAPELPSGLRPQVLPSAPAGEDPARHRPGERRKPLGTRRTLALPLRQRLTAPAAPAAQRDPRSTTQLQEGRAPMRTDHEITASAAHLDSFTVARAGEGRSETSVILAHPDGRALDIYRAGAVPDRDFSFPCSPRADSRG
jgi:hypothetical protein